MADGVIDQVEHDPSHLARPALDVRQGGRDDEPQIHSPLLGLWAHRF